jgi:hypothetical protein
LRVLAESILERDKSAKIVGEVSGSKKGLSFIDG